VLILFLARVTHFARTRTEVLTQSGGRHTLTLDLTPSELGEIFFIFYLFFYFFGTRPLYNTSTLGGPITQGSFFGGGAMSDGGACDRCTRRPNLRRGYLEKPVGRALMPGADR
jgi:hypothetical protein